VIARPGTGWQTTLADLSLILFLVVAAGASQRPPPTPAPPVLPAASEPVAVWRDVAGGPTLAGWLAHQGADPRQRLTLFAPPQAAGRAQELAREARRPVRLVLDPELAGPPYAALTYDRTAQLAHRLLETPHHP
jgi:hypothetical protein